MRGVLPEGCLTFRFSVVGLGNCPVIAFGGQPDTLLATGRGNRRSILPHQRLPCVKGAVKNLFDF